MSKFGVACVLATIAFAQSASVPGQSASSYPSRPITLVVPFTPGTNIDILARVIGPKMNERWKQPIVVDNKPGASGNIGSDFVAKSAPNGYTLMVTVNTFSMAPALYRNLPFDPVNDFVPVIKIALSSFVFVVDPVALPTSNFAEFLANVRAKPGQLNYGSPGNGTPHHLAMELLKLRLGLNIVHVPYKGLSGAMTDLLGGQVQVMFAPVQAILPNAKAGKLKILAVTGPKRSPLAPGAPTFHEQGMDFMDDVDNWYAVLAPANTPPDIIAKLNGGIAEMMGLTDVRENLMKQGMIPVTSTPGELAQLINTDLARWQKVVADAKIKAD